MKFGWYPVPMGTQKMFFWPVLIGTRFFRPVPEVDFLAGTRYSSVLQIFNLVETRIQSVPQKILLLVLGTHRPLVYYKCSIS